VSDCCLSPNEQLYIELQFNCNICLEGYESKHFMMTFYSRIDVAKYVGRLCVLNPDRQIGFDRFSGKLAYKVISSKISIQRWSSMCSPSNIPNSDVFEGPCVYPILASSCSLCLALSDRIQWITTSSGFSLCCRKISVTFSNNHSLIHYNWLFLYCFN
jgi:hypothetical protein